VSRRGRQPPRESSRHVVGVNPVRELLRAGATVNEVLVDVERSRTDALVELIDLARDAGVPLRTVDRADIDDLAEGLVHQGVLAVAPPFRYAEFDALLAADRDHPILLVALDGVTDPHNLGSIARTAEAVGADGMVIPSRRAATVTAVAEKAASGAFAHLPVAIVTNLVRALDQARDAGCWVVGLDADADIEIGDCNLLTEPLVLVVGSEGRGLAHLSQVHCDQLVSLPMRGRVASLNASVAAGIALYEVDRGRRRQGG
jgi:23S rRNA (guanosine2251-2'-O)-methyltransferase